MFRLLSASPIFPQSSLAKKNHLKSSKPADLRKKAAKVRAPPQHVGEREADRGVGVQYGWNERGEKKKKLRVIVPAQCTQLSIVQVLRASAITAQLMPVA